MSILNLLMPYLLYLFLFSLGVFVIVQNSHNKILWYVGLGMLCGGLYIAGYIMGRLHLSSSAIGFWTRFLFVPAEIATLLWFFVSLEFADQFNVGIRLSKIVRIFVLVINFIIIILLCFTNVFVDYSHPLYIGKQYLVWDYPTRTIFLVRILFMLIKLTFPIVNYYIFLKKSSEVWIKRISLVLIVSSVLLFLGVNFSQFLFFFRVRYDILYTIPEYIQEIFIMFAMLLLSWSVLNPHLLGRDFVDILYNFLKYIGSSSLFLVPYIIFLLVITNLFGIQEVFMPLLVGISGLVIITHQMNEWGIGIMRTFLKYKKFKVPLLLPSDVSFVLQNFTIPCELEHSRLLMLSQVHYLARRKSFSRVEALQEIIIRSIEFFKPQDNRNRRTTSRIKYEILKMLAYDNATESQIMWDLGFDSYNRSIAEKISNTKKPRFQLQDPSEYGATSDRSFKRLKKEAVEMLLWKIEQSEKIYGKEK
jgi:hypothetical protein